MNTLRYTLRGEGTSDKMLMPILAWVMDQHFPNAELYSQFADASSMPPKSGRSLAASIRDVLNWYPCDVLFVHRDADHPQNEEQRREEIHNAFNTALLSVTYPIPIVPIRMSEAWMLIEEVAIRNAAGNPNGNVKLNLPAPAKIEAIPQPKEMLCELLTSACELSGRRLKAFQPLSCIPRVAHYIRDFTPLRKLPAFQRFERDVQSFAEEYSNGMNG